MPSDAGLYIHVPFCLEKCGYCAFNSRPLTSAALLNDYVAAVERELASAAEAFAGQRFVSLYFGGGTPSLAAPEKLGAIVAATRRWLDLAPDAEITLEANPATLTAERLAGFARAGFNRLSVGVQSFDAACLGFLESTGRGETTTDLFAAARTAGFDAISLDFIVGLPAPFDGVFRGDLARAIALAPEHLSVYLLSADEPSRLAGRVVRGEIALPDRDAQADVFLECDALLTAAGYEHYEVSNFARGGWRARHNGLYWTDATYVGVGAGAHSFHTEDGALIRRANVAEPERYIALVSAGQSAVAFREEITPAMRQRERVMLQLRTTDGLAPADFGEAAAAMTAMLERHARAGRYTRDGRRFRPTAAGLLVADGVALELWDALGG